LQDLLFVVKWANAASEEKKPTECYEEGQQKVRFGHCLTLCTLNMHIKSLNFISQLQ